MLVLYFCERLIRQSCSQNRNLSLDHLSTWTTNGRPSFNTGLKVEDGVDVICELPVQTLKILQCQLIELAFSGLRQRDRTA